MSETNVGAHRRRSGAAAVALAWVPGVVALIRLWPTFGRSAKVASDYTLFELSTLQVEHGRLWTGALALSRFRNLGPVQLWWSVPFYEMSGRNTGGLVAAAVCWQLAWVGVAVAIAVAVLRLPPLAVGVAALAVQVWLGVVADPWNPGMTLWPLICLALLSVGLNRGRWWLPGAWVLIAAVAIQVHLAAAVVVIVLSVPAGFSLRKGGVSPAAQGAMAVAAVVAIAPVVAEELLGDRNLSAILNARDATGAPAVFGGAARESFPSMLFSVASPSWRRWTFFPFSFGRYLQPTTLASIVGFVLVAAALIALFRLNRAAPARPLVAAAGAGLAIAWLCVPILGERYRSYYLVPMVAVIVAIVLVAVISAVASTPKAVTYVLACAGVVACVVTPVPNPIAPIDRFGRLQGVEAAVARIPTGCPVLLRANDDGADLVTLVGIGLALAKVDVALRGEGVTATWLGASHPDRGEKVTIVSLVRSPTGSVSNPLAPRVDVRLDATCRRYSGNP